MSFIFINPYFDIFRGCEHDYQALWQCGRFNNEKYGHGKIATSSLDLQAPWFDGNFSSK